MNEYKMLKQTSAFTFLIIPKLKLGICSLNFKYLPCINIF